MNFSILFAFVFAASSAAALDLGLKAKLYSESLSSQDQRENVLTETRLRLHGFSQRDLQPFVGFYKNSFNYGPTLGLLFGFGPGRIFHLLAEQRYVYDDRLQGVGEGRLGLIYGQWLELGERFFVDTYGESIYIPRIDPTPVSTLWAKLGKRFQWGRQFYVDPHVQIWTRASQSRDLGEAGSELRPALRLQWVPHETFVIGFSGYRRFTLAPVLDKGWEALFVIQGEF